MTYRTPGVYVEEISKFPPSVAEVETAIPAFIGYTENIDYNGQPLTDRPTRISSLADFEEIFGGPFKESFTITVTTTEVDTLPVAPSFLFKMHYCMRHYFDNGGGPCYIVSVGDYTATSIDAPTLTDGLNALAKEDEPTLILFPDATAITDPDLFYGLYKSALMQCANLGDRFTICDIWAGDLYYRDVGDDVINRPSGAGTTGFRSGIGNNNLKYGAAYYPWLETIYTYAYDASTQAVTGGGLAAGMMLKKEIVIGVNDADEATSLFHTNNDLYHKIVKEIEKLKLFLPAGPAMAGVYANVDSTRGVWKAPANISLNAVRHPAVILSDADQEELNVHSTGKSVNAIRQFAGKGSLVWGARTLAGNDNEWRYISVRRFFNMVEESVKKSSEQFVFEPNDANTWAKIRSMIKNYLVVLWRQGALAGATPEDAFFVSVGLGETMTALDILEGRMNIEIGMAAVRPAEFIILKFSHKMQLS